VYQLEAPIGLSGLWAVYALDRPDLHEETWTPMTPPYLATAGNAPTELFAVLRERDVLVHHPYDSFATSVEAFISQAADDPDVLGIKQTLYRTSGDSPIVASLIRAAESGKQVAALVELKARFDELANIGWPRPSKRRGCTSSTASWGSRPIRRPPSCCGERRMGSAGTATSARATTTRRRPASTRTSGSSRRTRHRGGRG